MIIEPSINSLMDKVDSKYTLCILAGKRARQLTDGANRLTNYDSKNELTIAINEIDEKKITYTRAKSDNK